jgi:hypothetical protein
MLKNNRCRLWFVVRFYNTCVVLIHLTNSKVGKGVWGFSLDRGGPPRPWPQWLAHSREIRGGGLRESAKLLHLEIRGVA